MKKTDTRYFDSFIPPVPFLVKRISNIPTLTRLDSLLIIECSSLGHDIFESILIK